MIIDINCPLRGFDESTYLKLNPDVSKAVQKGDFSNGWEHYISYGFRECHQDVSLEVYRTVRENFEHTARPKSLPKRTPGIFKSIFKHITKLPSPKHPGQITIIGRPFASLGKAETLRSYYRGLCSMNLKPFVLNIFGDLHNNDPDYAALFEGRITTNPNSDIRIFDLNDNEIEPGLQKLDEFNLKFEDGINIVCPAWELPHYPPGWARQLEKFDIVWAISRYIQESISSVISTPVHYVGQSVERSTGFPYSRKYFGIRESSFTFLFIFDLASYPTRKNPQAVLTFFSKLVRKLPDADMQLVIKIKNQKGKAPESFLQTLNYARELEKTGKLVLLNSTFTNLETTSLIMACDSFVSLHRSEGLGRSMAEAMMLGKIVIATGYSGNMDFMNTNNSIVVPYSLIPVPENAYPYWQDQVWAEPDIEAAVDLTVELLNDPKRINSLGRQAKIDMRRDMSDRAHGLRMLNSLYSIKHPSLQIQNLKTF